MRHDSSKDLSNQSSQKQIDMFVPPQRIRNRKAPDIYSMQNDDIAGYSNSLSGEGNKGRTNRLNILVSNVNKNQSQPVTRKSSIHGISN
jgi:hypothetical protein